MSKLFLLLLLLFTSVRINAQVYSLKECVEIALMNKESLKSEALNLQSAEYGKKGSLSHILPSVSYGNSWSETKVPKGTSQSSIVIMDSTFSLSSPYGGVSNSFGSSFSVNQTIYDGGQWLNQMRTANNNYLIAKQSARQEMISVVLNVHQAFYEYLKSRQLLEVAKKTLDLALEQIELVSTQFELGAVKKTDLLKAEVQLGKSKTDVLLKETRMKNTELVLRNSMGLMGSQTTFEVTDFVRPLLPMPELKEAIDELEEYNPTLLIIQSQITGLDLNRRILTGTRRPKLSASMMYGASTPEFADMGKIDNWTSTLSLSLSFPIFTGYNLTTREQQAELAIRKQQYNYVTQKHNLHVQLENLLNIIEDYQELIPLDEQILASAEEDLKLVQQRYSLGSATILEILDAQVSVTQARSALVTTKYDARIQEAQLRALLGTLDQDYR
ncbi:MAG: TolC family protein [Fidelibacterota bacterium]